MSVDDSPNPVAEKWRQIDLLLERLLQEAVPDQFGAVHRSVIAQERADGLFEPDLGTLPLDRQMVALALVIELQSVGCAIIDADEEPERFREAHGLKARFGNVALFERGRRLCVLLLSPTPPPPPPSTPALPNPLTEGAKWN